MTNRDTRRTEMQEEPTRAFLDLAACRVAQLSALSNCPSFPRLSWTFAGTPIKSLMFPAGSVEMVGVKRVDNRPGRRRSAISRKPGSRLQSQNSGDAFKNTRSAQPRSSYQFAAT